MKQSLKQSQGRILSGRSLDAKILHYVTHGLTLKQAWKRLLDEFTISEKSDLPPCLTKLAKRLRLKP